MPYHDTPIPAELPEVFEDAYQAINFACEKAHDLLQADVRLLETIDLCIFAYFNRDEVFYVNPVGRALLEPASPAFGPKPPRSEPIFWLEDNDTFAHADHLVLARRRPIAAARELVTFSWGKSWLEGAKLPILARDGSPIAILFAGREIAPANQIRRVADHYHLTLQETGNN